MGKTLTYEIPDELYAACEQIAARTGRTTEAVVLEYLAQNADKSRPQRSEEERRQAREGILKYAGIWDSGDPNSADNERIDADLARGYGSTHEDED